jgi:hypothetical protein
MEFLFEVSDLFVKMEMFPPGKSLHMVDLVFQFDERLFEIQIMLDHPLTPFEREALRSE